MKTLEKIIKKYSYGKLYNMDEYYSGWAFESEEKYNEFLNIN